ncbi:glycosyltransferase family 4 protein [Bradyrhizobium sp. 2TAF24]|uniref:glycosyltransferase family 4 protein n=1 Tax=Bradyrhizobium sp. 2TAF24 TaxID=3233011 RepID=UPI003F8F0CAA
MSPLRVLCVTPFGPSGRGGIDRLYFYLRSHVQNHGLAGIDLRFAQSRGAASGNGWIATFPFILARIAGELGRFRPHVVHLNFATGGSLPRKYAILKLAKAFGARVIVHFHGQFIEDKVLARTPAGRLFKAIATGADLVIALGEVHADGFRRIGVDAAKIAIVPNGIPDFASDSVLSDKGRTPLRILFSGLLTENKGMQVLIPALALLKDTVTNWHCVAAGNGEVAAFSAMADQAGLRDRMTFTGWIEADEMHRHMREADVVVLPSRTEALPLSLIEGACAGAALVATDVGNVRSIVADGVNGVLVRREPEPIAKAFAMLASDQEQLKAMQAASRRIYCERFTIGAFAEELRAAYLRAASPVG